ncbi:MAG: hypothetical protein K9J30_14335, partial [Bacteroidales bacterium]|nr:hypothetical protein [Bacteroidales bacterium]
MKKLSIIILIVSIISMISCMENKKLDNVKQSGSSSFQPKPLDDEWSKWLVGDWEISGQTEWVVGDLEGINASDIEKSGSGWAKIELDINSQFLIIKSEGKIPEMTDEQIQNLKESTQATDEEIKRFVSSPFVSLQIFTIDPKTGDIIAYLFDSLRSIAEGKGKQEGNKQIIEWKWYSLGQGVS